MYMKKATFILILIASSLMIKAQDDEMRTLFGNKPIHLGGFGGPFMSFTTIDGKFAHIMGGGGGLIINDFFIGGYGMGLTNAIPYLNTGNKINFGHGGFWLGYNFSSKRMVHPALHLQLGWGQVSQVTRNGDPIGQADRVFVVIPTLEVEMNVTTFFKLGLGANYRSVFLTDQEYSFNDLSAPEIFLSFKFGAF